MTTLSIGSVADSITAFFHDPKNTTVTRQRVKPKLPTNYRPPVLPKRPPATPKQPKKYNNIVDYLYHKNGMIRMPHTPAQVEASLFWQYLNDCIDEGLLSWELLTDCPSLLSAGYIWLSVTRVQALLEEQNLLYADDYHKLPGYFLAHPAYSHRRIITSETSYYHSGDNERRLAYCFRANALKKPVNCVFTHNNTGE